MMGNLIFRGIFGVSCSKKPSAIHVYLKPNIIPYSHRLHRPCLGCRCLGASLRLCPTTTLSSPSLSEVKLCSPVAWSDS